jgi:hypothetical protein
MEHRATPTSCGPNPCRMNTCKSVSKQRTLTSFRMNTYEKRGGGGSSSVVTPLPSGFAFCFQQLPTSFFRKFFRFTFIQKPPRGWGVQPQNSTGSFASRMPSRGEKALLRFQSPASSFEPPESDELTIMESHSYTKHPGGGGLEAKEGSMTPFSPSLPHLVASLPRYFFPSGKSVGTAGGVEAICSNSG